MLPVQPATTVPGRAGPRLAVVLLCLGVPVIAVALGQVPARAVPFGAFWLLWLELPRWTAARWGARPDGTRRRAVLPALLAVMFVTLVLALTYVLPTDHRIPLTVSFVAVSLLALLGVAFVVGGSERDDRWG
jgi:hypothetical protein